MINVKGGGGRDVVKVEKVGNKTERGMDTTRWRGGSNDGGMMDGERGGRES